MPKSHRSWATHLGKTLWILSPTKVIYSGRVRARIEVSSHVKDSIGLNETVRG